MNEIEEMSLTDIAALRSYIHKKYSGLIVMGDVMTPWMELADKYCIIMKKCDEVFDEKLKKYLDSI